MQIDSGDVAQQRLGFGTTGRAAATTARGNPTDARGAVFASRDFEDKLVQFVESEVASSGRLPTDAAIQARARELAGFEVWQAAPTPADDPVLLAKLKTLAMDKVETVLDDVPMGTRGSSSSSSRKRRRRRSSATAQRAYPAAPLPEHTPVQRGLDAIDPGLLPALDANVEAEAPPQLHLAIYGVQTR